MNQNIEERMYDISVAVTDIDSENFIGGTSLELGSSWQMYSLINNKFHLMSIHFDPMPFEYKHS